MSVSPTTAWQSSFTDCKVSLGTSLTDKSPSPGLAERNVLALVSVVKQAKLRNPTGDHILAPECVLC